VTLWDVLLGVFVLIVGLVGVVFLAGVLACTVLRDSDWLGDVFDPDDEEYL